MSNKRKSVAVRAACWSASSTTGKARVFSSVMPLLEPDRSPTVLQVIQNEFKGFGSHTIRERIPRNSALTKGELITDDHHAAEDQGLKIVPASFPAGLETLRSARERM